MILVNDPTTQQVGVQVNPRDFPDAVYNQMHKECDNSLFCAGMFFFRSEADRLWFILKYDKLKKTS